MSDRAGRGNDKDRRGAPFETSPLETSDVHRNKTRGPEGGRQPGVPSSGLAPVPGGDSVSRSTDSTQPTRQSPPAAGPQPEDKTGPQPADEPERTTSAGKPSLHVVLYQPEIPQNTGNIGRTCVAVEAKLWIVRPAAFQFDEKRLRRAGLDYWQHLDFEDVANWEALTQALAGHRFFFFSRFAKRTIWEAEFAPGDVLVFGRETSGLPSSILDPDDPRSLRLPTSAQVRSLNLATTVGIAVFEHQRQTRPQG